MASQQKPMTYRPTRHPRIMLFALVVAILALAPVAAQSPRSFLWKATGKQSGVVYLAGSVHLLTKDYYPLAPALEAAFKDSDLLVEEIDLEEMLSPAAQFGLLTRGMLPATQSLDKVVSPATYQAVVKRTADLGLPIEPLKRFKPWMLALTLASFEWQKAGFDADFGLDKHFFDRAKAEGKMVQGLETLAYQVARFDELPMEQQDRLLADSLKSLDTEKTNVTSLADAWKTGDVDTVQRLVLDDLKNDPDMYKRLLVERNRNWLPRIEALFSRPGHAMVVVGAAHLVGPDGLLTLLKARGYSVEQQ